MQTFTIRELQNENSLREGEIIQAKSLTHAKRIASARQAFYGTVLVVESESGLNLSVKKEGKWIDK